MVEKDWTRDEAFVYLRQHFPTGWSFDIDDIVHSVYIWRGNTVDISSRSEHETLREACGYVLSAWHAAVRPLVERVASETAQEIGNRVDHATPGEAIVLTAVAAGVVSRVLSGGAE